MVKFQRRKEETEKTTKNTNVQATENEKTAYENHQIIRVDSKSSFIEILDWMFDGYGPDSDREGNVVLVIQENSEENGVYKMKSKAQFYISLSEFSVLHHNLLYGGLCRDASREKIRTIIENLDENKYSPDVFNSLMREAETLYDNCDIMPADNCVKATHEFADKIFNARNEEFYKPKNGLAPKTNFFCKYIDLKRGGTSAERAGRPDKKPLAREFVITPGTITDWVLSINTGAGKQNDKGGFSMEKREQTVRVPISHEDFKRLMIKTNQKIKSFYIKKELQK